MKRAPVTVLVAPKPKNKGGRPVTKKPEPPKVIAVRQCTREGCARSLKPNQRKYCSPECRNTFLSSGQNGGGRPPKYKPTFATTVLKAYLEDCKDKHEPTLIPTEKSYIVIQKARMPSIDDYAEYLIESGHVDYIATATLDEWAIAHSEFAFACSRILRVQKNYLSSRGLSGEYSSAIAKMHLAVNHGMIERSQVDHTHKMLGVVKHIYQLADATPQPKINGSN